MADDAGRPTGRAGLVRGLTPRTLAMLDSVVAWRRSGLSRRAFAKAAGLSAGTLGSWAHRLAVLGIDVAGDGTVSGVSTPEARQGAPAALVAAPEPSGVPSGGSAGPAPEEPGPMTPGEVAPRVSAVLCRCPGPAIVAAAPPAVADPPDGVFGLESPAAFLNRELTWLVWNRRVLHEAEDPRTPLLERVKFLAIVDSTLDEFFMKRVGGLKQQVCAGVTRKTTDGRTPEEQLDACHEYIIGTRSREQDCLAELLGLLAAEGIRLVDWQALPETERACLREWYLANVFPLVTPQAMDPAHPFPFISNLSLNLLVTLHHPGETADLLARVKVPLGRGIRRLVPVGTDLTFVPLEQVIAANLDLLFPEMEIESWELFRVIRNANAEMDEEQADDLLAMIESELRERKFAPTVRLQVAHGMVPRHRGLLAAELGLDEGADVREVDGMLGLGDLMELLGVPRPDLKYPPHSPPDHPALAADRPIFHAIREEGPLLLMHPYFSFNSSVERMLREAAADPKVLAIKMTLYRTSEDTQVIGHLRDAARNGKQVAVVVELKARFDEAANIRWATRLEEVGIHVTYGVVGLKTHCKLIQIIRRDYDGLRTYAHIGTGNYHAGTSRLYVDLGLLTCDTAIGRDLTEAFNYLTTGFKPKRQYQKLLVAPKSAKPALLDLIEREICCHAGGAPGLIQIKTNALDDLDVARALYRASQAGVRVDLLVRDTCRLRPGLPGLSENIGVTSIVGRFLEHSRMFYFRNGGDDVWYIGSADLMKRNLSSRVEVLVPVEDPRLRAELRQIMDLLLNDQRNGWDMLPGGAYAQRLPRCPREETPSQQALIELAESRHREATRLRRRKPQGIARHGGGNGEARR